MDAGSNNDWRNLKLGDRIRIVQIPSQLSESHYQNDDWDETFALYRKLISDKTVLTISEIDEFGHPWIEFESHNHDGAGISNSLAVDDDGWEFVE